MYIYIPRKVGGVTHAALGRGQDGSGCGGRVEGAAEVRVLQVACGRRHRYAVYASVAAKETY
jgi:hypothetical protein